MSIAQSLRSGLLLLAWALLIGVGSVALAEGYYREDIVRAVCRKDGCDEFSILEVAPGIQARIGTLLRATLQRYHASYQGRADRGTEELYAFCSYNDPTLIAPFDGKLVAFHLAPLGREREPRDTITLYAIYFAACHGLEAGKKAAANKGAVAAPLGYERNREQLQSEYILRIEDFLASR